VPATRRTLLLLIGSLLKTSYGFGVLSLAGCGLAGQSQSSSSSGHAGVQRHTVAVQRSAYQLVFASVEVNGHSTLALLDSGGATGVQLAASLADQLGLPLQATTDQRTRLDTSSRRRQTGTLTSLVIGDYRVGPITFDALEGDVERIARQVGTSFEVILGWQFFTQFYCVLDYAQARLDFEDSSSSATPHVPPSTTAIELDVAALGGVPLVTAQLNSTDVRFVLDTGAPISTLDKDLVNSVGPASATTSVILQGQPVSLDVRDVVLGGQHLLIGFETEDLGALRPLGAAGSLGTTLLAQFRLVLDGPGRRAYLA
jgi:predicted aspartyl protease